MTQHWQQFFDLGQSALPLIAGEHHVGLVILSFAIALLGAYTSLLTLVRANSYRNPLYRHGWLFVSAIIAGLTVWSMHFIGMLAFKIPLAIEHQLGLTIISVVPAVLANWYALGTQLKLNPQYVPSITKTLMAGGVLGIGIGGMHYIGMAAMQFNGVLLYHVGWFLISLVVALSLGVIAMLTYRSLARYEQRSSIDRFASRLLPATVIAVAISGMHYTAMTAARFYGIVEVQGSHAHSNWLAYVIGFATVIAAFVAVVGTKVDKRLYLQAKSQREAKQIIHHLATQDTLTGLANRQQLLEHLENLAVQFYALVIFDLDKFKTLNNTYGASYGDMLLRQVGERLRNLGVFCARIGGNEFVLVLPCPHDHDVSLSKNTTLARIEAIQEQLEAPYQLGHFTYLCTVSIGITRFQAGGKPDIILGEASLALAQAKLNHHHSGIEIFRPELAEQAAQRIALETDLRQALKHNQLQLFLQSQVNIQGEVAGAEGLLRWQHPQRGFVSPAEFIPLAEDTGLIIPIGRWVIEQACVILKRWQERAETQNLTLAINVSGRQFQQPDFVDNLIRQIQQTGINPNQLKLEITESLLLHDVELVAEKMKLLTEFGVHFAIDDFGTGYSSLSYLAELPFETLKIDISFVRDMLTQPSMASIVKAIIQLAESLQLTTVAEGVETHEQAAYLKQLGCHTFQGFLFSRPTPAEVFTQERHKR
ncbi:putative bifunctional diguanylate cyclase/phosphodiesterase [Pseudidiomarina woesei]|uniref:cyclic-guanylate-specific phosphodiesterase n=1 Tax=Pseudidiomarina woesei TaxID=1381080 RepID=A0A0K6H304_9GAMM|nr:EAL domain-containing protein [Pseudidiomarina woesei]CUA85201.1 diguanylate cyclase (GGDEF) domain [Pseudidiomarina woesei]